MIYRGIVEQIIDRYTVKVRIPLIHRASNSNEYTHVDNLPEAKISTLPNTHPNIQCGDVVVVAFENNDSTRPIIIGYLYREELTNTSVSTTLNSLEVIDEVKLSPNTSIGDISAENLQALAGIKENIQHIRENIHVTITR